MLSVHYLHASASSSSGRALIRYSMLETSQTVIEALCIGPCLLLVSSFRERHFMPANHCREYMHTRTCVSWYYSRYENKNYNSQIETPLCGRSTAYRPSVDYSFDSMRAPRLLYWPVRIYSTANETTAARCPMAKYSFRKVSYEV
jgi:hypothetical protein